MTKADLVRSISAETGIIRKDVALAVDAFLESLKDSLKDGKHIEIRGFGTFKLKVRKERMGRNPKTGESIQIPAKKKVAFRASKDLKSIL